METKSLNKQTTFTINKLWKIFPIFSPTLLSLINLIISLSLLGFYGRSNISPESIGPLFVFTAVGLLFTLVYFFLGTASLYSIIYRHLYINSFQVTVGDDHLVVQSGILNKSERTIPFSVIQNIVLSHSLTDYYFGLASIFIENASNSGMAFAPSRQSGAGFSNMVFVPCLSSAAALDLRNQLLDKVKLFNSLAPGQGI
ncbi:MAG: PH domain-containing protein [Candidatus Shapirobacteria bacterium]|jgi:uncharacterized membrane protein YdbT with pleckstrin-like domain